MRLPGERIGDAANVLLLLLIIIIVILPNAAETVGMPIRCNCCAAADSLLSTMFAPFAPCEVLLPCDPSDHRDIQQS